MNSKPLHSMRYILVLSAAFLLSMSTHALAQSTPDPSPNDYIDVSQEPSELEPLESLIIYPEAARRSGLEGKVTLQVLINKDGSVEKVQVLKSTNDIFEDAAINAMKRAHFTPAMNNGTPLKIWITRTINFRLSDEPRSANNNQNEGNSNYQHPEYHPHYDFRNLIGLNIDSARGFFKMFGDVSETKAADGIHLHAENSQTRITREADGIVSDNGLTQITVVYRSQNDTDFARTALTWNVRGALGSKLVSQTAVSEFPNALMTVVADAKERTRRIELKSK